MASCAGSRRQSPSLQLDLWRCVGGMKTVLKFFSILETNFKIFRSNSPVTVFFENVIGFWNFLLESVSA